MSVNNRDIGCLPLDDFKLWSTRALKVFLSLRESQRLAHLTLSCKVSQVKSFPYLLELNIVIVASVGWDSTY